MHIDWTAIFVALIAFLGSAGIWTYIDHKQQRRAEREMQSNEILKEVKTIRTEIAELSETVNENEAKASRIRILKFADEIFMAQNHSKDSFDQCMADITYYEDYCSKHPSFKNHQTEETCEYILEIYHERMQKKDFARYGSYRNGRE